MMHLDSTGRGLRSMTPLSPGPRVSCVGGSLCRLQGNLEFNVGNGCVNAGRYGCLVSVLLFSGKDLSH